MNIAVIYIEDLTDVEKAERILQGHCAECFGIPTPIRTGCDTCTPYFIFSTEEAFEKWHGEEYPDGP